MCIQSSELGSSAEGCAAGCAAAGSIGRQATQAVEGKEKGKASGKATWEATPREPRRDPLEMPTFFLRTWKNFSARRPAPLQLQVQWRAWWGDAVAAEGSESMMH